MLESCSGLDLPFAAFLSSLFYLPFIPLPVTSMDRGAWQIAVHGVAKSQTRLSTSIPTHKDFLPLMVLRASPVFQAYLCDCPLSHRLLRQFFFTRLVAQLSAWSNAGLIKREHRRAMFEGDELKDCFRGPLVPSLPDCYWARSGLRTQGCSGDWQVGAGCYEQVTRSCPGQ